MSKVQQIIPQIEFNKNLSELLATLANNVVNMPATFVRVKIDINPLSAQVYLTGLEDGSDHVLRVVFNK